MRGGEIYGRTDKHAAEVVDQPVSPADITATLFAALGVDPGAAIATAAGKPHRLSTGRILSGWFGG
jgi:arylsulfatase A-like enzyme